MSCATLLKASEKELVLAQSVRFNLPTAFPYVDLRIATRRSKTGMKRADRKPNRPSDESVESNFVFSVMCDDSLHKNEIATPADLCSRNRVSISANHVDQDEFALQTDSVHENEFALSDDCVYKNDCAPLVDSIHQDEIAKPTESVLEDETSTLAHLVHKDEISQPTEIPFLGTLQPDVTGDCISCRAKSVLLCNNEAAKGINLVPLVQSVPLSNASTKDRSQATRLGNFPFVAFDEWFRPLVNAADDGTALPTINAEGDNIVQPTTTAYQEETFNIDNLVCLSDETATKIARLVLCSFNLGNLLLNALRNKEIVDVINVLEYSVVKVMASVAKKYLEINKSMLEEAIQLTTSPILHTRTKAERTTPTVMMKETDNSRYKKLSLSDNNFGDYYSSKKCADVCPHRNDFGDHYSSKKCADVCPHRNYFDDHYSSKKCADVCPHRNDFGQSAISSSKSEINLQMDESEFANCRILLPSASTPKSICRDDNLPSFFPENSDLCTYNQIPTQSNTVPTAGVNPNKKTNNFRGCNQQLAVPNIFGAVENPRAYPRHGYIAEPHKYQPLPIRKSKPGMDLLSHEHDEEFSESVKRIADSSEEIFKHIQHEERQFHESQNSLFLPTSRNLIDNQSKSFNKQQWYTDNRQSLGQISSYDHYCGVMNVNSPCSLSQFITNHPRSGDHSSPNTNVGNAFEALDQVRNGNFHSNCYSEDFHNSYQSPPVLSYPVYSQQPTLHSVPHYVPNFQVLHENVGGHFQFGLIRNPTLVNATIIPPRFQYTKYPTSSNDNYVHHNTQYPLEKEGYFHKYQNFYSQDQRKLKTAFINRIPEEVPSNNANFAPTSSISDLNNWSKPSIYSSISVIRGLHESFDDLGHHSNKIYHPINSSQSESLMADSIESVFSTTGTENNTDGRKVPLPEFFFQTKFSEDSLNLSFGSNGGIKETEGNGTVELSMLSYSSVPRTATEREYSFSSDNLEFLAESNTRKRRSPKKITNAKFPLLYGEFYNKYDVVNQGHVQHNVTSPTAITLSTRPFPSRLCTSSLPYELQTNGTVRQTESRIHKKEDRLFQCSQTLNVSTNVPFRCENPFSADIVPMDSMYSGHFYERLHVTDEKNATQKKSFLFNSNSVLTQSRESLKNLELYTQLPAANTQNFQTSSTPYPAHATSNKTKLEAKQRDDKIYHEINKDSVACQTSNWMLFSGQVEIDSKNSENSSSSVRSLREECSCKDSSYYENCPSVNKQDVCRCRDEPFAFRYPMKLKQKRLHCCSNQACSYCQTLLILQKHCHCSRRLNFYPKYTNLSEFGHRSVYPNRTCAVNNLTCCEALKNCEWKNFMFPQRRCRQFHQRLYSENCKQKCNCSKICDSFTGPKCCACNLAGERDCIKSRCWAEDGACCSEIRPNNWSNCCVHCKRVHKNNDTLENLDRAFVSACLRPSNVLECNEFSRCLADGTCAVNSNAKPKARKSLFPVNQFLKKASILKGKYGDVNHKSQTKNKSKSDRIITGSLPDYCEMKRKLSLYATEPQITKASSVDSNCSGYVNANTKSKDSNLPVQFSPTAPTDSIATTKVDKNKAVNRNFKVSVNYELIDDANLLDAQTGTLVSAVKTRKENSCHSIIPNCGAISENCCGNVYEQNCAVPIAIQSIIITPAPLHKHLANAHVEPCSSVANGRAGICNMEQGCRSVNKNKKVKDSNTCIGAEYELHKTKCKELFQAVSVEKYTVRKLVALFEGFAKGNL